MRKEKSLYKFNQMNIHSHLNAGKYFCMKNICVLINILKKKKENTFFKWLLDNFSEEDFWLTGKIFGT